MWILCTLILILWVAYLLLLMPRIANPAWTYFTTFRYAHRGLHDKSLGIPENSLPAFRRAVEHSFGAELDVHLLRDGTLAVFHDSNLQRICGVQGKIEDLTAQDLKNYHLLGTDETIPLFSDVLEVFRGKTPLIIELKVVDGNAAALTDAVMEQLRGWSGHYCIESFHPAVLAHLKKRYPYVVRGQLSENFLKGKSLKFFPAFSMTYLLTTAFTKPDFIAYNYEDRSNFSLFLMRQLYGVHEVSWTVSDPQTMQLLELDGITPIFENFIPGSFARGTVDFR